MSSTEIGEAVGIAAPTARTYLSRAYGKLGVAGSQKVIEALRTAIETHAAAPTIADDGPAFSPAIIIAVPAVVIMFASIATGLVPGAYASLVANALALAVLVVGIIRLRELPSAPRWMPTTALLVGSALALVSTAVALGPEAFLIRHAVLGLAVVAAALILTRRASNFNGSQPALTCAFTGLVALCLVPCGI